MSAPGLLSPLAVAGLPDLAAGWWDALLPVALQAALLGVLLLLADAVLLRRRAPPSLRLLLWSLVTLRLALPLPLSSPLALLPAAELLARGDVPAAAPADAARPASGAASSPAAPDDAALARAPAAVTPHPAPPRSTRAATLRLLHAGPRAAVEPRPAEPPRASAGATEAARTPLVTLAFVAWAAVTLALGTVLLVRDRRLRARLLRPARPAPARVLAIAGEAAARVGLRRAPPVLVTRELSAPAVLGALRPVVLLPHAWLAAGSPAGGREELLHVLLHELAHVRRRDPLLAALCRLAHLPWWFHPLAATARARQAAARELAADALVARVLGADAPRYRATLVRCARRLLQAGAPPQPAPALALLGGGDVLRQRLDALALAPHRDRPLRSALVTAAAALLLLPAVRAEAERPGQDAASPPPYGTPERGEAPAATPLVPAAARATSTPPPTPPSAPARVLHPCGGTASGPPPPHLDDLPPSLAALRERYGGCLPLRYLVTAEARRAGLPGR